MEKTPRTGEGNISYIQTFSFKFMPRHKSAFSPFDRAHLSITFQENYEKLIIHLRKFNSVSRFSSSALSVLSSCCINFDFNFPQVIISLFFHTNRNF